jgi:cadmium resistance protein CadD (predicted permease)
LNDYGGAILLVELIGVMGVTGAAFVSTNLDNLVIVSAYGGKSGYRPFALRLAFVLVCLTVLLVSLALARAADTLAADKIRYLGFVPVAIGAFHYSKLFFGSADEEPASAETAGRSGIVAYLSFALVLLANSSDSVILLTPLLADLRPVFVLAGFAAALTAAFVMSLLAQKIAHHPRARVHLEKFAKWVLPGLLIAIGALILFDEPSVVLIG